MDKLLIYTVYDKKAQRFDTPFFCSSEVHAKRQFIMFVKSNETVISNFKDDFSLIEVGNFNILTGDMTPLPHTEIIRGSEIAKEE